MIRFDTLDKKPKLYDLLIIAAVFLAAVGAMACFGIERFAAPICALAIVFCIIVIVRLITAFIGQLRYNPYSYNTIYYVGFALFVFSITVTLGFLLVKLIAHPVEYSVSTVLSVFLNSAKTYMLFSAPFIFLFSAALLVSNVSLLLHERKRFANVLGIILALLMTAGELLFFRYDYYATGSQREVMMHDLFGNLFAAVYLYYECMLIGAIVANIIAVRYEPEKNKDFIIILGCGLRKDGSPTPLLKGRIERAITFAERQKAETGKDLVFITSGGQGANEPNSESLAMKRYLIERGVPEERIIEEDRSTDTLENMRNSKQLIDARGDGAKVAFATTNYHVFRSGLAARRVKLRAVGVGAKTKWYFWPNAAVREFVGLVTSHRVKQAIILGSMAVFYVLLTIYYYR